MASISPPSPHLLLLQRNPISLRSTVFLPFPCLSTPRVSISIALKATGTDGSRVGRGSQGSSDPALLRRPLVSSPSPEISNEEDREEEEEEEEEEDASVVEGRGGGRGRSKRRKDEEWVDWEDQILEDTVPLVGFVRMILHSGKYESGDRLSPEHEKTIMERLLPYHPESEKKIGCGIDFITIGFHPEFENSRCLFIVRKDGELVDFSYWKCIKGLIRKNYPLYADSFILRHFRRRRHTE